MTIVLTTGCYLNTSSVVHFCSSPLFIPDSFNEPFPCPFNTMDFGHSTARRFVGYSCKSPTKAHLLAKTPSSFIQHVNELGYFYISPFTSGHTLHQLLPAFISYPQELVYAPYDSKPLVQFHPAFAYPKEQGIAVSIVQVSTKQTRSHLAGFVVS